jgi:hypothetical protein
MNTLNIKREYSQNDFLQTKLKKNKQTNKSETIY